MPPMTGVPTMRRRMPDRAQPPMPTMPPQAAVEQYNWNPIADQYEQAQQQQPAAPVQQPAAPQPAGDQQFMQPQKVKGFRQWLLEDYGVNEMPENARVDIQQAQRDYARYRQSGSYGGGLTQYQMMNLLLSKQRNDMTLEDRESQASNRKADNLFRAMQHIEKQMEALKASEPYTEQQKIDDPDGYAAYQENARRLRELQKKYTSLNNRWLELTDPELAAELYEPGDEEPAMSQQQKSEAMGMADDYVNRYSPAFDMPRIGTPPQGGGAPAPTASPGQPTPAAQPAATPQPQAANRKFVVEVLEGAKRGQRLVVDEKQLGQIPQSSYRIVDEYKGR